MENLDVMHVDRQLNNRYGQGQVERNGELIEID